MKELETLIYSRMVGDTAATVGLVTLMGGTASHIRHAFLNVIPVVPYLTYQIFSVGKGMLGGNFTRSLDVFVQFNIFAINHQEPRARLVQLFDGYRFDVPAQYTEIGQLRGVLDFEGPDGYDEMLEVNTKQVRYRFFVTPKAWDPVTA